RVRASPRGFGADRPVGGRRGEAPARRGVPDSAAVAQQQSRPAGPDCAGAAGTGDHRPRGPRPAQPRPAAAPDADPATSAGLDPAVGRPGTDRPRRGPRPGARDAPSRTRRRVKVVPVSVRGSSAVRDALLSHGWEGGVASDAVAGAEAVAFLAEQLPQDAIAAMVPIAARLGLELFTGPDWIVMMGSQARFGAFARPWLQPEPVQALATAIGMAMPGQPRSSWRCAHRELSLDRPVMMGIINVTPDSFSPSSRSDGSDAALEQAGRLI